MTYEEFEMEFYDRVLPEKPKDIRRGQELMIFLWKVWDKEFNRILSIHNSLSTIDCFYRDSLIPNTLKHLRENWHKYPN